MTDNSLISVIIPVYNVERYLRECVDSVINQTYKNLEIILVDDGSTDNCPQICDEYAAKDPRVKVIHKANGGLGPARNSGLDVMTGDYIGFADSDDFLAPEMYEILLDNLETAGADISVCGYFYLYKNNTLDDPQVNQPFVITAQAVRERPSFYSITEIKDAAWNKLYKKSVFDGLRYTDIYAEDAYLAPSLIFNAGDIVVTRREMYYYRQRTRSIMNDASNPRQREFITVVEHIVSFSQTHCPQNLPYAEELLFNQHCEILHRLMMISGYKRLPLYKEIKRYLKRSAWHFILRRRPPLPARSKIKALILWLNMDIYRLVWRKYIANNEYECYE
jgi:glycosyltransferase involved in cell wall biosynthesis